MGQILLKKTFFCGLMAAFLLPTAVGVVAPAAYAQFSDSYNFLKAVKDRKGEEAEKFLSEPGTVIINTRDGTTGETALHIVIQRRDSTWLGYLLQKGANPNLADKKGTTPLMLAISSKTPPTSFFPCFPRPPPNPLQGLCQVYATFYAS